MIKNMEYWHLNSTKYYKSDIFYKSRMTPGTSKPKLSVKVCVFLVGEGEEWNIHMKEYVGYVSVSRY